MWWHILIAIFSALGWALAAIFGLDLTALLPAT